jgi:predicted transcriptional regulator
MKYKPARRPKREKERERLIRLKPSIEAPAALWCNQFWLNIIFRLIGSQHNKSIHNTSLISGLQLVGLSSEETSTLIGHSVEHGLIEKVKCEQNLNGAYSYKITRYGKSLMCSIANVMSEVMTRKSFDEQYPFASNLHNSKGHRFKSKF